ncbi:hypothetical protein Pmani_029835 [Petrolisthes manimaculis]|uniref:Uncharacterized protein n=1 Tax=Petrolisthes manimaculis TaxID=1843537 RepID=A0AAE1NWW3_9EUCA|nr:hypothetical protein Pmani_029835 [Petrolisthes manimaculis]
MLGGEQETTTLWPRGRRALGRSGVSGQIREPLWQLGCPGGVLLALSVGLLVSQLERCPNTSPLSDHRCPYTSPSSDHRCPNTSPSSDRRGPSSCHRVTARVTAFTGSSVALVKIPRSLLHRLTSGSVLQVGATKTRASEASEAVCWEEGGLGGCGRQSWQGAAQRNGGKGEWERRGEKEGRKERGIGKGRKIDVIIESSKRRKGDEVMNG